MTEEDAKRGLGMQKRQAVDEENEGDSKRRRTDTEEVEWRSLVEKRLGGIEDMLREVRGLVLRVEDVVKSMVPGPSDTDGEGDTDEEEETMKE